MNTTLQDLSPELLGHILSFLTQTHDITVVSSEISSPVATRSQHIR